MANMNCQNQKLLINGCTHGVQAGILSDSAQKSKFISSLPHTTVRKSYLKVARVFPGTLGCTINGTPLDGHISEDSLSTYHHQGEAADLLCYCQLGYGTSWQMVIQINIYSYTPASFKQDFKMQVLPYLNDTSHLIILNYYQRSKRIFNINQ